MPRLLLVALTLSLAACSAPAPATVPAPASAQNEFDAGEVEAGVRAVLAEQVLAWNSGSVRGFMDGYWRSDSLAFLSGGSVRRGWQDAYYAYVRGYPDEAAMGVLSFTDLTVRPLSARHALVWGRWGLRRADDTPNGLFSLLFERTEKGWKVVHDHTSSGEE